MTMLSARTMADRLTEPFAPGADSFLLDLAPGATADIANVVAYTDKFTAHRARHEHEPDPFYLLVALRDVEVDTTVTVTDSAPATFTVNVPAGTLQGTSLPIVGASSDPTVLLTQLQMAPAPATLTAGQLWGIAVLLGNTARLLWAAGWERDQLQRHMELAISQRHLARATDKTLDYLGSDLSLRRFPPLPYSFDDDTLALYHMEDRPVPPATEVATVADLVAEYGLPGNPGTNVGANARSRAQGRFGLAFAFESPNAVIEVPGLAAMPNGAANSFTAELFLKPTAGAPDGHALTKHANPVNLNLPGWALSVGEFGRGVAANLRLMVSDGTNSRVLFADQTLGSDRFHHVAAVIDRAAAEVRLVLNGVTVKTEPLTGVGALTNAESVRIGRGAAASFRGTIDEVRISSVARATFNPVTGEADDVYKRRIAIFGQWRLPTPANLQTMLNDVVGQVAGTANPIVVDDVPATMVAGELSFEVQPVQLNPGTAMAADGTLRAREADVVGTLEDALRDFAPFVLQTVANPNILFVPPEPRSLKPNELPPDPHRMQIVVETSLLSLLGLMSAFPPQSLRVESAFDPRALDIRAVGRGLMLSHTTASQGILAANAHRAGFDFVQMLNNGQVYVSCADGEELQINLTGGTATPEAGLDLLTAQTLTLAASPAMPPDTLFRWTVIAGGAGRAAFDVTTAAGTTAEKTVFAPTVTLRATSPGVVVVKVTATRQRRTATGTRALRIGIPLLANNTNIGDDGSFGVAESFAGERQVDDFFATSYLVTHDSTRVDYGTNLNNRRMQPVLTERLDVLLGFLASTAGNLQIVSAFVPGATDLTGIGRGLRMNHPTLSVGRLGALAHAAGFTFVRRAGGDIFVRQAAGDFITVGGTPSIDEGANFDFRVAPRAEPAGIALTTNTLLVANAGTDTLSNLDVATGQVRWAAKVGWQPVGVALNVAAARAYTADLRSNTVTAVAVATGLLDGTVNVQQAPIAVVHHPTQPRLYVACRGGNRVQEINSNTLAVTGTVALGASPRAMAMRPDGSEVWLAMSDNRIAVVRTAPFALNSSIALAGPPTSVAFLPSGVTAYAPIPSTGQLAVITVATQAVANATPLGATPSAPDRVTVAPNGLTVYVTDLAPGAPQLLLLNPNATLQSAIRMQPELGALVADANRVYVLNAARDGVAVVGLTEQGLVDMFSLGTGLGESLNWILRLDRPAKAALDGTTAPVVNLSATNAGKGLARAIYVLPGGNAPYTYAVRLVPPLDANLNVLVRKEQYDLLMNVLSAFRPIGTEVNTRAIREHVVEVRQDQLQAFPEHTFPDYQVHGPVLGRPRRE